MRLGARRSTGRAGVVLATVAGLVLGLAATAPARAEVGSEPGTGSTGVAPLVPDAPNTPPKPAVPVTVSVSPSAGSYVGVAMPITARFSTYVSYKTRAEKGMRVFLNGVLVKGAWHWKDGRTAVFRPQYFWPSYRTVGVRLRLHGVVLRESADYRYVGASSTDRLHGYKIGRRLVAYVDNNTLRMRVLINGDLVRTMPVSLGKEGFITRSGVKAVMEKYLEREMTSEALGITDPNDQYRVISPYAVRITSSGEFTHGAPWATSRIGRYNGSHGCTNMFVSDAKWLYYKVRPGDPLIYRNTGRPMEPWNGTGGPWNISWTDWLAKSALGVQSD